MTNCVKLPLFICKMAFSNCVRYALLVSCFLCVFQNGLGRQDDDSSKKLSAGDGKFKVIPPNYDKLKIPISKRKNYQNVKVSVSIMIHEILEIDELNEQIVLDTDFSMRWLDGNIFDHYEKNGWKDSSGVRISNYSKLEDEILEELWTPDVFIDEMEKVQRSNILSKPIMLNFLGATRLGDDGEIVYSARIIFKLMCGMTFQYYPADTQTCVFHLRSYSYKEDELILRWRFSTSIGVFLDSDDNSNFDLQVASAEPLKKSEGLYIEENFDKYRRGNYSALRFTVKIRRKMSYHLVQTYLPSILLILITWLCFFLPTNMVEARIGISMTTVLTLTAMFAAIRQKSPDVSYTMAIDVWMVFCIFFVFLALLLFTTIYWMKKKLNSQSMTGKKDDDEHGENGIENGGWSDSEFPSYEHYTYVVNMTKHYAFWVFAVTFIVFCVLYWGSLLHMSEYLEWDINQRFNGRKDDSDDTSNLYRYIDVKFPEHDDSKPTYLELVKNKTAHLVDEYRSGDRGL